MKKGSGDFLSRFLGDAARARALRVLTLNQHEVLSEGLVARRASLSLRGARTALTALEKLGLARRVRAAGGKADRGVRWCLDPRSTHLPAVVSLVRALSALPHDQVLGELKKAGKVSVVVLSGSFTGDASRPADIVLAGDGLNERRVDAAIRALETLFGRELRYAAFPLAEFRYRLTVQDRLVRDTLDYPHQVLLDRSRVLRR